MACIPEVVRGDDMGQLWHGQIDAMLGQQPGRGEPPAPVAAVASDLQHGETWCDLAERHDARSEGFGLSLCGATIGAAVHWRDLRYGSSNGAAATTACASAGREPLLWQRCPRDGLANTAR
jgi:hypothetical protein